MPKMYSTFLNYCKIYTLSCPGVSKLNATLCIHMENKNNKILICSDVIVTGLTFCIISLINVNPFK